MKIHYHLSKRHSYNENLLLYNTIYKRGVFLVRSKMKNKFVVSVFCLTEMNNLWFDIMKSIIDDDFVKLKLKI